MKEVFLEYNKHIQLIMNRFTELHNIIDRLNIKNCPMLETRKQIPDGEYNMAHGLVHKIADMGFIF